MLFLMVVGLILIFGVMGLINFVYGLFYMIGVFCVVVVVGLIGLFLFGLIVVFVGVVFVGVLVEFVVICWFYDKDYLD